jgi:hypothetical protein
MEELANFLASCEFDNSLYFWIAGTLVLLLIFFPWARKRRRLAIDLQYWKQRVAFRSKRVWLISIPIAITSILIAGALSTPQVTTRATASIYGKPVMLVVDVSGSMMSSVEAQSKQTSRDVALEAFNYLSTWRSDINFGLILYGNDSYVARYFIYKNELLKDSLENKEELYRISTGSRGADALAKARLFFADNIKGDDKAIVLISDFNFDRLGLLEMIEEMERVLLAGINIYMIYVGGGELGAVDIPQMPGLKIVDINDTDGIDQIYEEMSAMQNSLIREEESFLKESLIPFLILPALGMIILCLVLVETRFRKIP